MCAHAVPLHRLLKWLTHPSKHFHKHVKPYHCKHADCKAAGKGFSSPNDLARHMKSVHHECADDDVLYICRHGTCGEKNKPKLWPRADNFRSHLTKVHQIQVKTEDLLKNYIHKYGQDCFPPLLVPSPLHNTRPSNVNQELKGVGTVLTCDDPQTSTITLSDSEDVLPEVSLADQPRLDRLPDEASRGNTSLNRLFQPHSQHPQSDTMPMQPTREDEIRFIHPQILNGRNESHALNSISGGARNPIYRIRDEGRQLQPYNQDLYGARSLQDTQDSENTSDEEDAASTPKPTGNARNAPSSVVRHRGLDSPQYSSEDTGDMTETESTRRSIPVHEVIRDFLRSRDSDQILGLLKSFPKQLLESALRDSEAEAEAEAEAETEDGNAEQSRSSLKPLHPCNECKKTFKRPCELK